MEKYSKQVTEEAWLICPNWTELRRFIKNKNNTDKFVDCMAKFSSIYMHSCEDLTETTGLLIAIIEQIESQKGELNHQQIDFLRRCLED